MFLHQQRIAVCKVWCQANKEQQHFHAKLLDAPHQEESSTRSNVKHWKMSQCIAQHEYYRRTTIYLSLSFSVNSLIFPCPPKSPMKILHALKSLFCLFFNFMLFEVEKLQIEVLGKLQMLTFLRKFHGVGDKYTCVLQVCIFPQSISTLRKFQKVQNFQWFWR